jgi:hypothetical protein
MPTRQTGASPMPRQSPGVCWCLTFAFQVRDSASAACEWLCGMEVSELAPGPTSTTHSVLKCLTILLSTRISVLRSCLYPIQ